MRFARCVFIGLLVVFLKMAAGQAEETPAPVPDPLQQMQGEIATLRTVRLLASASRNAPPTREEIENARRPYEDLIKRYPQQAEPHVALGEYFHSIGHFRQTGEQWDQALVLDRSRADVYAAKGDLLLGNGQIVEAADNLEKAARLEPKNAAHLFGLGNIYSLFRRDLMAARQGSETEMINRGTEYFRQAAALAPENLAYARAYAESFYTQPNPDWSLAREAWERLAERSEEKSSIHSHLVRVNIRLRDKTAALRHLEAMIDPAFAPLKLKLRQQIDRL